MKNKLILAINDPGLHYSETYSQFFGGITTDIDLLWNDPSKIGLVSFTGGEDVSPELYDEENVASFCNIHRDRKEARIFDQAVKCGIFMAGICRGSQFLNVMCGGRMVQNLNGHAGIIHTAETYDGEQIHVTSTHHQMSVLGNDGVLLAKAEPKLSNVYETAAGYEDIPYETEAFIYPKFNVIGWQYHPEMVSGKHNSKAVSCVEFTHRTLSDFINRRI